MIGSETVTLQVPGVPVKDRLGVKTAPFTDIPVPGGSVQPRATNEDQSNVDFTESEWVWFAPCTTEVLAATTDCRAQWRGMTFLVWGDPKAWYDRLGRPHHVTVPLKEFRG